MECGINIIWNRAAAVLVLATLALAGACGKRAEAPGDGAGRTLEDLKPGDVVVSVNGTAMTKADLEARADLAVALQRMRVPALSVKDADALRRAVLAGAAEEFIVKTLLCGDAKEKGAVVTPAIRSGYEKNVVKTFGKAGQTIDAFYAKLGKSADAMKKMTEMDLQLEALTRQTYSNEVSATEAEVDEVVKRLEDANARATLTNAVVYARASNVWQRVKSGEDFGKMADQYSEDDQKEPGGVWGDFTRKDFADNPNFCEMVFSLPVGGVSEPVDADGGLILVKVLKKTPAQSLTEPEQVSLAEIFFHLPLFYEISREYIANDIRHTKQGEFFRKLVGRLREQAEIEYPNGKDVFPKGK
jgi:parvulin-like peptidyl-prolyl isomerase